MMIKSILFNTVMVQAILDGRKTMTRRLIKPQPATDETLCQNPYAPGDILWVKERFYVQPDLWDSSREKQPIHYFADGNTVCLEDYISRPSIFMPRWAARIWLEVKKVQVQRIQDITEQDALTEGVSGIKCFESLWNSIYGKRGGGWETNPYVWVIEFERIEKPEFAGK